VGIPPGRAVLVLECGSVGPPLVVQIRKLARLALRCYGLRAVQIELQEAGATPPLTPAQRAAFYREQFPKAGIAPAAAPADFGDLDGGELIGRTSSTGPATSPTHGDLDGGELITGEDRR
jgi:hypothetical protein